MNAQIQQRTPEWFAARAGKVTASRIADVLATTQKGWGASRIDYMAQLAAERLTGEVQESYVNAAMQWGTDHESQARGAYADHSKVIVEEVGFIDHPRIAMSGASPDGIVGDGGLIEIKCPNTSTHIDWLLDTAIPGKYSLQMQWQMACTGRAWCDFVSFDPRMPKNMQLHIERVPRDQKKIHEIEFMVVGFIAELEEKVAELSRRYGL